MSLARVRALIIVGALVLMAVVTVTWAIVADDQGKSVGANARNCPEGAVPAATAVPEPKTVTIRVYNSTDQSGLAGTTASQLKTRGFKINKVGDDPLHQVVHATAQLRYGPKAVGSAHLLKAYLLGAEPAFDIKRTDAVVDVVLGTAFKQVNTQSEVNQALVALGRPVTPKGTC